MKTVLVFFLSIAVLALVHGQNYLNVANLKYYYMPPTTVDGYTEPTNFNEFRADFALPYEFDNKDILGLKVNYKSVYLASNIDSLMDLKIYSFKLPIFGIYNFKNNDTWSMYAEISPKLNSDLKNISLSHFQIGGMVLFFKEKKKDLYWQFGIFYNQDTYGPFIMPLFGLDYKINEKNYLGVLAPAYFIYERKLSDKLYVGLEAELTGETFRLGEFQSKKLKDSYISQFGEDHFTFLVEPRLFIDFYISENMVAYLKPGVRMFHKYEHFLNETDLDDNGYDDYAGNYYMQGQLKDNFYLELGLAYRFRYDAQNEEE